MVTIVSSAASKAFDHGATAHKIGLGFDFVEDFCARIFSSREDIEKKSRCVIKMWGAT